MADVTALDRIGIPVFQAVRPASRNLSVSQGKGATPDAARASAVMEAIELWHAEDLGHLAHVLLSPREMRFESAVPLASLRWQARLPPEASVLPLPWVRARRLGGTGDRGGRDRDGWLPRAMLELAYTRSEALGPGLFRPTSNGLASGNVREEALLHGLCELIERHALYLAHAEPHRRRPLAVAGTEVPWLREPIERVRAAGLKLAFWDLTWEAGIATVLCDLAAPDIPNVWRGSGSHPDPAVAASRALTEAAQSRLTYISGSRDDLPHFGAPERARPIFDAFAEPAGGTPLAELPDLSTASVAGDLDVVVGRLAALGYPAFWVDLSRPDFGVPVTVTFVPGLKDFTHG